jgi:iron complex transport system ATP-binding protein
MAGRVIIVSGEQGSGKTTFLAAVMGLLKGRIKTGGLLARGVWHGRRREGFTLEDLSTGRSHPYCRRKPAKGWEKLGNFYVSPEGKAFGEVALSDDHLAGCRLVAIDEVGPFELEGKGWNKAVSRLVDRPDVILLLVVRKSLVGEVVRHWGLDAPDVFDVAVDTPAGCAGAILSTPLQSL